MAISFEGQRATRSGRCRAGHAAPLRLRNDLGSWRQYGCGLNAMRACTVLGQRRG